MCVCLCVCLCVCIVYLCCLCVSVCVSVLSVCLCLCMCVCVCVSVYVSVCVSVCLCVTTWVPPGTVPALPPWCGTLSAWSPGSGLCRSWGGYSTLIKTLWKMNDRLNQVKGNFGLILFYLTFWGWFWAISWHFCMLQYRVSLYNKKHRSETVITGSTGLTGSESAGFFYSRMTILEIVAGVENNEPIGWLYMSRAPGSQCFIRVSHPKVLLTKLLGK